LPVGSALGRFAVGSPNERTYDERAIRQVAGFLPDVHIRKEVRPTWLCPN
jgi:hypothetical protein